MTPLARATRCVSALAATSTMCAWPCGVEVAERAGGRRRTWVDTKGKCFRCIIRADWPRDRLPPAHPPRPDASPCLHLPRGAARAAARPGAGAPSRRRSPSRWRSPARAPGTGARPEQAAGARRHRLGRLHASAPNASSATRSCARSTPTPTTSTTRSCSSTCESVWQPLVAASRSLGNITADIDQRFAWQPFLVRDPSVNAFALPGGFVGVHLGLIAITTTPRRAGLGARPRDVARHAAPHRAQHHGRFEALAGRPGRAASSACSRRRAAATPTR